MSAHFKKTVKRKRKVLTLSKKIEILDKLGKGESFTSLARSYRMNESSVRAIKKCEQKIRLSVTESDEIATKMSFVTRSVRLEKTERALYAWIKDQMRKKVPLTSLSIREKAKHLHDQFPASLCDNDKIVPFLASKGWFEKFKNRFCLNNFKLIFGKFASGDHKAAKSFHTNFRRFIEEKGYKPEQVFNADETYLFWKRMPSRTFLSKTEKTAADERLTVLLCVNASGYMIKSILVNARAPKGEDVPVFSRANEKVCVTAEIFSDWFKNCFVPEVDAYLRSKEIPFKVLLLIEDAPGYPQSLKMDHPSVEVMFLPPDTTSLIQPLDQGVIAAFKAYYVRRTFEGLLKNMEDQSGLSVAKSWKKYNMADCLVNIKKSMDDIEPFTINACWHKLWPEIVTDGSTPDVTTVIVQTVTIARSVKGEGFESINEIDIEEMILSDDRQELKLEAITLPNELIVDGEYENEVEVKTAKKDLSIKTLDEIVSLAGQLTDRVVEMDPLVKRGLKFKKGIRKILEPYEELRKSIGKKCLDPLRV